MPLSTVLLTEKLNVAQKYVSYHPVLLMNSLLTSIVPSIRKINTYRKKTPFSYVKKGLPPILFDLF